MLKSLTFACLGLGIVGLLPVPARADTKVAEICIQETGTRFGRTRASLRVFTTDGRIFDLKGKLVEVDGMSARQPATGALFVDGNQVTYGYEGFPTVTFPPAVKQGGSFNINTLTGNGFGHRVLPGTPNGSLISDSSNVTVIPALCAGD